jgi:hypothetical protein
LRPKYLLACFLPAVFGTVRGVVTDEGALANPRVIMLLHMGLVQLWLLPLWFSVRGFVAPTQRRRIESMLLAAVVMTVLAMLARRQLGEVPLLRRLGPEHLLVGNAMAFGFMSAAAAEEWVLLNAEECRAALKRLPIFAVLLGLLGLACVFGCRHTERPGAWPFWLAFIVAAAIFVALLIVIGMTLLKPSLRLVGYSLAALTFLSLLIAFRPGIPFIDRNALFPETPFITTLREIGERLGGSDTLARWPLAGNLIPQFYSPSGYMLERHAKLVERVKADPTLLRRVGAPALLLTKQDTQGAFASIRPALAIKHVFPSGAVWFKDLEAKPRSWVTYDWRVEEHFDPAAIHASLPPIVQGAAPPGAPATGPEAKVAILKPETSTRVRVEVTTERPGILILADACYPGWRATVNGNPAGILPVDGLFRGVPISEGKHQVEFFYAPVSLNIGSSITQGVGLLLLIGMCRLISRRLRKHPEQPA